MWEFSSSDLAFRASSIKPIPSAFHRRDYQDFIAISKDECLIVCMRRRVYTPGFAPMIYNGRNWKFGEFEFIDKFGRFHSAYDHLVLIDSRDMIIIAFSNWGNVVRVLRAPMLWSKSFGVSHMDWEELAVASLPELNALVCSRQCSIILHNQQLYFADAQGAMFTSFVQPPVLPVVWGKSGVKFQDVPRLVGLPNGTTLMIGRIEHQHGSLLDVIKVGQTG